MFICKKVKYLQLLSVMWTDVDRCGLQSAAADGLQDQEQQIR